MIRRNIVWVVVLLAVMIGRPASAQVYYPGSVWSSNGTYSAIEKGNFLSLTHAEQGIAWHGAELFTHVTFGTDSYNFTWNRKVSDGVGVRFTQTLFGTGMVRVGMMYTHEARTGLRKGNYAGFVETWFGWRQRPTPPPPVQLLVPPTQITTEAR